MQEINRAESKFLDQLKYLKGDRGLSQRRIAHSLGISEDYLSSIVNLNRRPSQQLANAIDLLYRQETGQSDRLRGISVGNPSKADEIRAYMESLIEATGGDADTLAWLLVEMKRRLPVVLPGQPAAVGVVSDPLPPPRDKADLAAKQALKKAKTP